MPWIRTGPNTQVFLTKAALAKRKAQHERRMKALENASELGVGVGGHLPACWPMTSWAAGVDPSQIKEQMAYDASQGVPTDYTKHGEPILTSQSHRKRYMHVNGLYDRNAGYGDPEPINR